MRDMIALGWTDHETSLPPGIVLVNAGALKVLCTSEENADTHRRKLLQQVSCFESGVDFVPVAAEHSAHIETAINQANSTDLYTTLCRIKAHGQLTITCDLPKPEPANQTGKHWLRARRARNDKVTQQSRILRDLSDTLRYPATAVRHENGASVCDLLVHRNDRERACARIADYLGKRIGLQDTVVTVTGLWPPFGFAQDAPREAVAP